MDWIKAVAPLCVFVRVCVSVRHLTTAEEFLYQLPQKTAAVKKLQWDLIGNNML